MTSFKIQTLFVPASLLILFLSAIFLRPLMPIDETRYMSVAWEMWLRRDWFAPLTMNFDLYSHKPPFLFWLINASWSVFGVSRWSALVPIMVSASLFVYLTQVLAKKLNLRNSAFVPYLVLGSVPFIIYSTLVMFDMTLGVFVLLSLLALLSYADNRKPLFLLALALSLGIGVLTKGPVAWLYVVFPFLLAPYWLKGKQNWLSWYTGGVLAFLLSGVPVLLWLVPVLKSSNPDFAFWLIWEQTAGRISGHMENVHTRPFYFYLPLVPILFLPWAFLPSFWTGISRIKEDVQTKYGLRFLACWIIPVIIAFSFIGGKQPHYLLPLVPGVLIFIADRLKPDMRPILTIFSIMILMVVTGQFIASQTLFKKYDLRPIAEYVAQHQDQDWAFVRKYQGELTYLGRLHKKMDNEQGETLKKWFKAHPEGLAVIRYYKPKEVQDYSAIMTIPYRGKNIGIFYKKN
ncbi:MAG: glycosyltransferase family 39 protein [Alphaproteobacteria bacterium]|nr:glycosyltransferase family 39 protein [Alphaproteobacteria bacterium]